ncbi:MAG: hypothetical protein QXS85_01685 [Acidilobaceae archaeon]
MRLKVVYDDIHTLHRDEWGFHVEKPERLVAPKAVLEEPLFAEIVEWRRAPRPDESSLSKVHSRDYVDFIREESRKGFHYVDPDTYVTKYTYEVALSFSTAAREAALDSLETGDPWLILPRPPGHHSGRRGWAMGAPTLGFCIFNHSAVATQALLERGFSVMVIDFDAHHGNGTQDILWNEPRALHIDVHQRGIYPGTGWVTDKGGGEAEGTKINIPLAPGSGDREIAWVAEKVVKPVSEAFKPDAVIVSAGFDGHYSDPLTSLTITEAGYKILGRLVREVWMASRRRALVIVLEGGYAQGLSKGFRSFLEGLLGVGEEQKIEPRMEESVSELLTREVLGKYWGLRVA